MVGPKNTLFLDEISTGLDSSTTFLIVRCVRNFAHTLQARPYVSVRGSHRLKKPGAAQLRSNSDPQLGLRVGIAGLPYVHVGGACSEAALDKAALGT